MTLTDILADDKNIILYRPSLNPITGSINATLLFSQLLYYAKISNNKFYKFKEPCEHKLYQQGNSWCEILGFGVKAFDSALKALKDKGFVKTKTTIERLTYYELDFEVIEAALNNEKINISSINAKGDLRKRPNGIYENENLADTETPKRHLHNNVNLKTYSETYSENLKKDISNEISKKSADFEKPNKQKTQKENNDFENIELPHFVNRQIWSDYLKYKKERKEKLTLTGIKAKFTQWAKWNEQGINVNECILETMAKEWKGVFKPQKQRSDSESLSDKNKRVMEAWAAEMEAKEQEINQTLRKKETQ